MPIAFVSLCAQGIALSQLPNWHHCGGVCGQSRVVPERALCSVSGLLPALAYSPPRPAYPGHQYLDCHRFRAVGNDASRWHSALQRSLECPQGGEASSRPVCPSEEALALLQPQRQQEAIPCTCFLRADGQWPGVLLLSVPPCSGGGLWLEAGPEGPLLFLRLAVWPSGPSLNCCPLEQLFEECVQVVSGEPGLAWKPLLSTQAVATDVDGPWYG